MATIELGFESVVGASPHRTAVLLHGILGSRANLRSVAKRFVDACPEWLAWVADLRGHGRSPKGTPGPSIAGAAQDVIDMTSWAQYPFHAIVGHSFGGKVALEVLRQKPEGRRADLERGGTVDDSLAHVVLIDSNPGAREPLRGGDSALTVLDTIESLPSTFATKRDFVAAIESRHTRALAQWLGMSTVEEDGRVRFALDLAEIRALLDSYFETDLWSVVESPPGKASIHLVIGGRSTSFSPEDRERALAIAAREPRVTVDVLPADHWVHVDDPEGLQGVLVTRLGARS